MFKKAFLLISALMLVGQCGFCAQSNFQKKFATCSSYVEDTGNKVIHLVGWANRKCLYRELDIENTLTCQFDRKQFKQINQEMALNPKNYVSLSDLPKWKEYVDNKDYCEKKSINGEKEDRDRHFGR